MMIAALVEPYCVLGEVSRLTFAECLLHPAAVLGLHLVKSSELPCDGGLIHLAGQETECISSPWLL